MVKSSAKTQFPNTSFSLPGPFTPSCKVQRPDVTQATPSTIYPLSNQTFPDGLTLNKISPRGPNPSSKVSPVNWLANLMIKFLPKQQKQQQQQQQQKKLVKRMLPTA